MGTTSNDRPRFMIRSKEIHFWLKNVLNLVKKKTKVHIVLHLKELNVLKIYDFWSA